MAQRRMLSKKIITNKYFMVLSMLAQRLYMILVVLADDRGYVDGVLTILRTYRATKKELNQLIESGFLLDRGDQLVLITHWCVQNKLADVRLSETEHSDDFENIYLDKKTSMYMTEPTQNTVRCNEVMECTINAKEEKKREKEKMALTEKPKVLSDSNQRHESQSIRTDESFSSCCFEKLVESGYLTTADKMNRHKFIELFDNFLEQYTERNVAKSVQYFIDYVTIRGKIRSDLKLDDKYDYMKKAVDESCYKFRDGIPALPEWIDP